VKIDKAGNSIAEDDGAVGPLTISELFLGVCCAARFTSILQPDTQSSGLRFQVQNGNHR
jgi:hypothetical protein